MGPRESWLSKERYRILEDVEIFGAGVQSVEIQESVDRHQLEEKETPMLPIASGLMAKPVACTFCNGPHNPKQCSVSMSVEDRFKKLKAARACYRCARSGHRMSACSFRKPCPCGRGSHIPQLCKTGGVKIPGVQKPLKVIPPSNPPNQPSWNPGAPSYVPSTQSQVPPISQPPQAAVMSSARNADIKTAGVMMRTMCVVIGHVIVRALCDTGATLTMMSSLLAGSVPKRVIGRRRLRTEALRYMLEGEFDVVEVTARGLREDCESTEP